MIQQSIPDLNDLIRNFLNYFVPLAIIGLVILLILTIWILGGIIKFFIRNTIKKYPDARNGLILSVNLIQLLSILFVILNSFYSLGADENFLIGIIAIIVAAIGVSSTSVAYNIIGGLYIVATRPFGTGDYIKTQRVEGIVEEIGLNYTKIVLLDKTTVSIPNTNLVNNSLLNYHVKVNHPSEITETPVLNIGDYGKEFISEFLYDVSFPKKIVRYQARIEFDLNVVNPPLSISTIKDRLENVCEEFTLIFGFKPEFYFGKYEFRQEVVLIITASNGYVIFNSWQHFMEAIFSIVYLELQREEKN
ncbi:MAG: mechanosensitive ion channel domain-containing protein [Candidatus Hodarchaeales archaeon]